MNIFLISLLYFSSHFLLASSDRLSETGDEIRILVKVSGNKRKTKKFAKKFTRNAKNVVNMKKSKVIAMTVDKKNLKKLKKKKGVLVEEDREMVAARQTSPNKERNKLVETAPWGVSTVLQDVEFWSSLEGGSPIKLCILSSGIDIAHEDLPKEPDVTGTDGFDEPWQEDLIGWGTHAAGIVSAIGGNDIGVSGILPDNKIGNFQLVIGKAFNSTASSSLEGQIAAMESCVAQGANVFGLDFSCQGGFCYSQIMEDFLQELYDQGVLIFGPTGDGALETFGGFDFYPAKYTSVITTAAVQETPLSRSDFSAYNDQVELSAPGSDILSTYLSNTYDTQFTTYAATFHAAGTAALVWMFYPECSNTQIRNALAQTALDLGETGCDEMYGYGVVQAKAAYEFLADGSCGEGTGATSAVGGCSQLDICSSDADCDDGDACTVGTCLVEIGVCSHDILSCADCGKKTGTVELQSDLFFEETIWEVRNSANDRVAYGDAEGELVPSPGTFCLNAGDYTFTIYDNFGDGICCDFGDGFYSLSVDGTLVGEGGIFGSNETLTFTVS